MTNDSYGRMDIRRVIGPKQQRQPFASKPNMLTSAAGPSEMESWLKGDASRPVTMQLRRSDDGMITVHVQEVTGRADAIGFTVHGMSLPEVFDLVVSQFDWWLQARQTRIAQYGR